MADKEKVIKGLEHCDIGSADPCYEKECPYYQTGCTEELQNDILAILKEQKAVTIKKIKDNVFGMYGGVCPKCANWIQSPHLYCGFCGQEVKWDG